MGMVGSSLRWGAVARVAVVITIAAAARPFLLLAQIPDGAVAATARVHRARVLRGDTVSIDVTLQLAHGFHVWPHDPVLPPEFGRLTPIATGIEATALPFGARIERIDWPRATPVTVTYTGAPVSLLSYAGTATARVLLRVASDAPTGRVTAGFRVRYQACDERVCYRPEDKTVAVRFRVDSPQR
jgi:hypothetical protein